MCVVNPIKRDLRRLKRKERELEYTVLNCAMVWYDLRGTEYEAERAEKLALANQALREQCWKIRRFEIEHQHEL